jgi:hypothetical protein
VHPETIPHLLMVRAFASSMESAQGLWHGRISKIKHLHVDVVKAFFYFLRAKPAFLHFTQPSVCACDE